MQMGHVERQIQMLKGKFAQRQCSLPC